MANHICKYCGMQYQTGVALGGHVGWCKQNPNYDSHRKKQSVLSSGRISSLETKQKISKSMKQRFKLNPKVKPFGGCRGKMSSYEYWFCQKVVKQYNLAQKYDIINEYYQYPYFLDFAFLNIKVDVQIDGQFHQNQDMVLSDQMRQKQLISRGWIVYHISYKDIKQNECTAIQRFLVFLKGITNISQKVLENQIVLYRKYKYPKPHMTMKQYNLKRKLEKEKRQQIKRSTMSKSHMGEKNSQYGTMWITNGEFNRKIKKDDIIPLGWAMGRVC